MITRKVQKNLQLFITVIIIIKSMTSETDVKRLRGPGGAFSDNDGEKMGLEKVNRTFRATTIMDIDKIIIIVTKR